MKKAWRINDTKMRLLMPKNPNLEQNPKKLLEGDLLGRVIECTGWLFTVFYPYLVVMKQATGCIIWLRVPPTRTLVRGNISSACSN
jgi:hypothetical protein